MIPITIVNGVYKPTYNWGGSQCMSSCLLNAPSDCDNQRFTDNHVFLADSQHISELRTSLNLQNGTRGLWFLVLLFQERNVLKVSQSIWVSINFSGHYPTVFHSHSGCLFLPSVEHRAATCCWTVAPHRRDSQRYLPASFGCWLNM